MNILSLHIRSLSLAGFELTALISGALKVNGDNVSHLSKLVRKRYTANATHMTFGKRTRINTLIARSSPAVNPLSPRTRVCLTEYLSSDIASLNLMKNVYLNQCFNRHSVSQSKLKRLCRDTQVDFIRVKRHLVKILVFFSLIFHSQSATSQQSDEVRKRNASLAPIINFLLDDETIPATESNGTPALIGHAGAGEVSLSWDPVDEAISYQLYYSMESFGSPVADTANYTNYANAERIQNIVGTSFVLSDLSNYKIYYFVLVAQFTNSESAPSDEILIIPEIKRNDTGLTKAGLHPHGIFADCSVGPTLSQQDCSHGRDVTHNDDSDGLAGFSFTKLDAKGAPLPTSATRWSCIRDNVTGLIWETKNDDGGIHDKDNTYRWGGKTALSNGYGTYYDDWDALVDESNSDALCGFSDWRVPSAGELVSIMIYREYGNNYGIVPPVFDLTFFPNTPSSDRGMFPGTCYWTASAFASDFRSEGLEDAWCAGFTGYVDSRSRDDNAHVRLVRSTR